MNTSPISVGQFQELLDRLGDDLSAWPKDIRNQAFELLETSDDARRCLAVAQAHAADLRDSIPKAPKGLVDRILKAAGVPSADGPKADKNSGDEKT